MDIQTVLVVLRTAAAVLLIPGLRAWLQWRDNALEDGKYDPWDWQKLIATEARILFIGIGLWYGLSEMQIIDYLASLGITLDIFVTVLGAAIYDFVSKIYKPKQSTIATVR